MSIGIDDFKNEIRNVVGFHGWYEALVAISDVLASDSGDFLIDGCFNVAAALERASVDLKLIAENYLLKIHGRLKE